MIMKTNTLHKFSVFSWITLAVAALLCTAVLLGTIAADAAWDGTAASGFSSGNGSEKTPYLIRNEKNMGYFIQRLNAGVNFENLYISLDVDLDMTGHPWTYTSAASFAGTFIGNAHKIKTDCTLFADIAETGTVIGLNVEASADFSGSAVLCGRNTGAIRMCCARGKTSGSSVVGMICAYNSGTVQYCGAIGSVSAYGDDTDAYAAMIAYNYNIVEDCFSSLAVTANATGKYNYEFTGPITGDGSFSNCYYDTSAYTSRQVPYAKGITAAEMKDEAFLNAIAPWSVSGYTWVEGTDHYPMVGACRTETVSFGDTDGDMTVFHTGSLSVTLKKTGSGGKVYYTLDGSDPRSSGTRKSFTTSSTTITVRDSTVVSACYFYDNKTGSVIRHTFVLLPGKGTPESPYQISTPLQLYAVRLEPDKCYKLTQNLTFRDEDYALGGVAEGGWVSIPSFSGTFDGDSHSISGLRGICGGLFAGNSGTIENLRLLDHRLCRKMDDEKEYPSVFGAIANSNGGTVSRCYAAPDPNVTCISDVMFNAVGGIVGSNGGTVQYCRSSGTIKVDGVENYSHPSLGGIVGLNSGTVKRCYSDAGIYMCYTNHDLGGIIGGITVGGYVYDCRFDGYCEINAYDAFFGVGTVTIGGSANSYRCYDGGASFNHKSTSGHTNFARETDLYKSGGSGRDLLEASFPAFDFDSVWMITEDGPFPQGVMDANGHCYRYSSGKSVSCTTAGAVTLQCDLCNTTKTVSLPAAGHSPVVDAAVPASCTAPGKTEGSHCAACGEVITAQKETERLSHDYKNRICRVCGGGVPAAAQGQCGESLSWEIGEDGVLILTGEGDMPNFSADSSAPWLEKSVPVKEVRLPEGITSVGDYAFSSCTALTEITVPKSVLAIGTEAFPSLTVIGYTGTAAHRYAKDNQFPFRALNTAAEAPTISVHPTAAEYTVGAEPIPLMVSASVSDGGVLSWQWYKASSAGANGEMIPGAESESYIPDITEVGCVYYYAIVTNTNADVSAVQTASSRSTAAAVLVRAKVHAAVPVITAQPMDADYTVGAEPTALSVIAGVTDAGTLSYQWYSCNAEGGEITPVEGAADAEYLPDTSVVGTKYYCVMVTNNNASATGDITAAVTSRVVRITVAAPLYSICGRITSVGDGEVTFALLRDGIPVEGIGIAVEEDAYAITNVPAGTYILRVSKEKHVMREYTVVVGTP